MKTSLCAASAALALSAFAFAFTTSPASAQTQRMYLSAVCDGRTAWIAVPYGADHAARVAARKDACPAVPPPRKVACPGKKTLFALVPGDIPEGGDVEAGYLRGRCGG